MIYTLDQYRRHAELYGPECVVEVAARDLDEHELAELAAYVKHLERTQQWKGGHWHERRLPAARLCAECKRPLPDNARSTMLRHKSCAKAAANRRYRQDDQLPVAA